MKFQLFSSFWGGGMVLSLAIKSRQMMFQAYFLLHKMSNTILFQLHSAWNMHGPKILTHGEMNSKFWSPNLLIFEHFSNLNISNSFLLQKYGAYLAQNMLAVMYQWYWNTNNLCHMHTWQSQPSDGRNHPKKARSFWTSFLSSIIIYFDSKYQNWSLF